MEYKGAGGSVIYFPINVPVDIIDVLILLSLRKKQ